MWICIQFPRQKQSHKSSVRLSRDRTSFIPKLLNGGFSACISKWQAFKLATLSGFAEPMGVIIVGMASDDRNLKMNNQLQPP